MKYENMTITAFLQSNLFLLLFLQINALIINDYDDPLQTKLQTRI